MNKFIKTRSLVAATIIGLTACGKPNDKPFSTFKIDGVEYKTNNVRAVQAHLNSRFSGGDSISFDFAFNSSGIPRSGERAITIWNGERKVNEMQFYFYTGLVPRNVFALSPRDSTHRMQVSTVDGVTTFTLEPSWFLREPDGEDSFLAEGVFVLPEVEQI